VRTVALDVHKRFAEVAVEEDGVVRRLGRVETRDLQEFAQSLGPDDHVVLESTSLTWSIVELIGRHAGRVTVSNPMQTRAIASAKVKTDKVDARVLAQLGAADFLPEVWAPDPATRALRRRVSHRSSLVRQRTRLRNQVHAVLARNLIEVPVSDLFGQGGRRWLVELDLPAHEREQIDSDLRLHDALSTEVELAERQLAGEALARPEVRRLMTIPGVGAVTALSLVAVVGEVSRFPTATQLVGYLGLDPRVRQSGDRPARHGHISRAGQSHARGLLVEAAHSAIRTPGHSARSTGASRRAEAARSRSARPPASSPSSPGTCSPGTRTTGTPPRRSHNGSYGSSSAAPKTQARWSASPARPSGECSSGAFSWRLSATTKRTAPSE
jgi:transposase